MYITKFYTHVLFPNITSMGLTPQQIAAIMKLRGLGWSQKEIAETVGASQQVIAYHLKKLKEESKKVGVDDAFSAAILGGMAVGAGIGALAILLDQLTKK